MPFLTAAQVFWRHLLRRSLPATWLAGLRYAIFGLGDSSYPLFNVSQEGQLTLPECLYSWALTREANLSTCQNVIAEKRTGVLSTL